MNRIKCKDICAGWVQGTVENTDFKFHAKIDKTPSERGMIFGRINKLLIWNDRRKQEVRKNKESTHDYIILDYDEKWYVEPIEKRHQKICDEVLDYLENYNIHPVIKFFRGLIR